MNHERFFDDVADAHARVERGVRILEDDLHLATRLAQAIAGEAQHVFPLKANFSRCRFDEPQDAAAGGRLATAGFTDQAERFAGIDREADPVDGANGCRPSPAEKPLRTREFLHQIPDLEQGCHTGNAAFVSPMGTFSMAGL